MGRAAAERDLNLKVLAEDRLGWVLGACVARVFPPPRPGGGGAVGGEGGGSYVAGLVHVREEPGDGHVADGLLEEHLLDGGRAHRAERRQQQEQLAEAARLGRVPGGHERGESNVSVSHPPSATPPPPGAGGRGFSARRQFPLAFSHLLSQ